jgi:hypothetical protein
MSAKKFFQTLSSVLLLISLSMATMAFSMRSPTAISSGDLYADFEAYLTGSENVNCGGCDLYFGYDMDIDGDTLVVGTDDEEAAYVFVRASDGTWSEQAILKGANTESGDSFGSEVAISGDTIIVGAGLEESTTTGVNSTPNNDGKNIGAAYIFVRSGTTWTQQAYLKAPNISYNTTNTSDRGDIFGKSVEIDGDTVVVGAYLEDSPAASIDITDNSADNIGAAYVFTRSGSTWSYRTMLKPPSGATDLQFGETTAIDGNTIVVGTSKANSNTGAAYIFTGSGSTWAHQQTVSPDSAGESFSQNLNHGLALDGDTLVVGAINESTDQNNSGAVYVFTRSGSTWTKEAKFKAPTP